jgi:uncharacterized FlgJ-related protein
MKQETNKRIRPIDQQLGMNKRLALLPYIDAQAQHETGNFTSRLANEQNNLFGMKKPNKRAFLGSKDSANEYMTYDSYSQSVQDLLLWMDSVSFPNSVSDSFHYAAELQKRKYFEDNLGTYVKGLNLGLVRLQKMGKTGFIIKSV